MKRCCVGRMVLLRGALVRARKSVVTTVVGKKVLEVADKVGGKAGVLKEAFVKRTVETGTVFGRGCGAAQRLAWLGFRAWWGKVRILIRRLRWWLAPGCCCHCGSRPAENDTRGYREDSRVVFLPACLPSGHPGVYRERLFFRAAWRPLWMEVPVPEEVKKGVLCGHTQPACRNCEAHDAPQGGVVGPKLPTEAATSYQGRHVAIHQISRVLPTLNGHNRDTSAGMSTSLNLLLGLGRAVHDGISCVEVWRSPAYAVVDLGSRAARLVALGPEVGTVGSWKFPWAHQCAQDMGNLGAQGHEDLIYAEKWGDILAEAVILRYFLATGAVVGVEVPVAEFPADLLWDVVFTEKSCAECMVASEKSARRWVRWKTRLWAGWVRWTHSAPFQHQQRRGGGGEGLRRGDPREGLLCRVLREGCWWGLEGGSRRSKSRSGQALRGGRAVMEAEWWSTSWRPGMVQLG